MLESPGTECYKSHLAGVVKDPTSNEEWSQDHEKGRQNTSSKKVQPQMNLCWKLAADYMTVGSLGTCE